MPSLRELPLPFRALFTSFLILIGLGYLMALSYLFLVIVEPHRQMGMGLVEGIEMQYHGNPRDSRLEAALRGPMAGMISALDRDRVLQWVEAGAPPEGYAAVKPIFERNCISCHSGKSTLPPLTSLDAIKKVAQIDTGPSIAQLARVSHVHLFGISFIFMLTGAIFSLSTAPVWFRASFVIMPYLSIVADIGSWWLTKFQPAFGIIVVISGVIMGLTLAAQILVPLWEMWFPAPWTRVSGARTRP